jgi:hypothetical protein
MEREVCVPRQHRKGQHCVYRSEEKRAPGPRRETDHLALERDSTRAEQWFVRRMGTEGRRIFNHSENLELSSI